MYTDLDQAYLTDRYLTFGQATTDSASRIWGELS